MAQGLMAVALGDPLIAGGIGAALGLLAAGAGRRVARWTHLFGLRSRAPGGSGGVLLLAAATGLLSAACASGAPNAARAALLGLVWGYTVLDLANNTRAAAALRAIATDGDSLGAWLALPAVARYGLTRSAGPAVLTTLAWATLLHLDPALIGFLAGASLQVALQRQATPQPATPADTPSAPAPDGGA